MTIVGINHVINDKGQILSTLHVVGEFEDYYKNAAANRGCEGRKAESIYVGAYDCTTLKVGMEIEILYDKAVSNSKGGFFQPVKKIEVLSSGSKKAAVLTHPDTP